MFWRLLALVLFAIGMLGVYCWRHYVAHGGWPEGIRWDLWAVSVGVLFGVAYLFDRHDRVR